MSDWPCGTLFDGSITDIGSLALGAPGSTTLAKVSEIISNATKYVMESEEGRRGKIFQYGPARGSPLYCKEVAKFLSKRYQDRVNENELLLTCGATHGLHLVASLFVEKDALVFVEDPTYFLAISLLKDDQKMDIIPVQSDDQGVSTSHLESLLDQHSKDRSPPPKGRFNSMMYIIPTFNNPKGISYAQERCHRLIDLARQYNMLIVCDDVYNVLNWDAQTTMPKRLLQYEKEIEGKKGHVISNGTFSKILGPGLRCGWIEASKSIIDYMANTCLIQSGGAVNHYTSQLIAAALKQGEVDQLLDQTNKEFLEKKHIVGKIFKEQLPQGAKFSEPEGGYFYWISLPGGVHSMELAEYLETKHGITIMAGSRCSLSEAYNNCIRISLGHYDKEILEKSVIILCKGINDYYKMKGY